MFVCLFVCLFVYRPVPISYRKMTKLSSECEYGWYLQECSQNRKKRQKYRGKKARMKPKAPWFDAACINSKRELNRLAKSYGKTRQANTLETATMRNVVFTENSSNLRSHPSLKNCVVILNQVTILIGQDLRNLKN